MELRFMELMQKTINKEVEIKGIGIHSGKLSKIRLIPAPENTGIIFVKNNVEIPATVYNVKSFAFSTTLEYKGERVQTVEHLLAALYLLGIDNIYVELEGDELPILDGSSKIFVEKIKEAGLKKLPAEKTYALVKKDFSYVDKDKHIIATISDYPAFTYEAKYNNFIGNSFYTFSPVEMDIREISDARTYCFLEEVQKLKEMGLAKGGSLENAVVIKDNEILNPEGLRYPDEPVRHKLLDLIGDLYLLGKPIIGNIKSIKGGHALNANFLKSALKNDVFDFVKASELVEFAKVN